VKCQLDATIIYWSFLSSICFGLILNI